jgi:hypothetical protein
MAKGRFISKEITLDRRVSELSDGYSMVGFTWLITYADCEGRIYGDPAIVKSLLFPRRTDITIEMVAGYIQEWADVGLIILYESDGDLYIEFPNFAKHQVGLRKDREAPSTIPPNSGVNPSTSGKNRVNVKIKIKNKLSEVNTCAKTSAEPEKTYQDCDDDGLEIPKRKTKKPKDSLYPIANAISNVTGMSLNANRTRIFKEAKLLCADPRVTPEEIIKTYSKNGDWYRLDWRGQKGQKPTLSQIRETIFTFDGAIPPNRPVPKGMPAVLAEFERLKQEVDIGDQV